MSTHNKQFHDEIENFLNYLFSWAIGRILQGLKNEFELAMVKEPSVFELLRVYCMMKTITSYDEPAYYILKFYNESLTLFCIIIFQALAICVLVFSGGGIRVF